MKKLIGYLSILLILVCLGGIVYAQSSRSMSVESFTPLPNDNSARIDEPKMNPDGDKKCAIIKVVTRYKGFTFSTGTYDVIDTSQRTGEIWVWVQPGVKYFTIKHQELGVMRNYAFPCAIEAACVYELRLTTAEMKILIDEGPQSGYFIVKSDPTGADVYVTEGGVEEWVGTTPFNKQYNLGASFQYRVAKPLYHDEVGMVEITGAQNEVNAALRPAFGSISVTSTPTGATVFLDNEPSPRGVTPLVINEVASGSHRLAVRKEMYGQKVQNAVVTDGATSNVAIMLNPNFARVTVNTFADAQILVDGAVKGKGSYSWNQSEGVCEVATRLAGYRDGKRTLQVVAGQDQIVQLNPSPMYGRLNINSEPMDAEIWIDGRQYGTTPNIISNLLATEHSVTLRKNGCADFATRVTIEESKEATVVGKLETGKSVTISTGSADDIYVDDTKVGVSPLTATLAFGTHNIYAMRAGKKSESKTINISTGYSDTNIQLSFVSNREFNVKGVKFTMIAVEGGSFTMGGTSEQGRDAWENERPTHNVTLDSYLIGQTEVTQELWKAVMGTNPSYFTGYNLPVEQVSWNDCQEFIKKLNSITGENFRLPTEAEWEYAARGGQKSKGYKYSGSNNIDNVAWYDDNSSNKTHAVATKQPNELGIYDMSGNVWEWCSDWYGDYGSEPQINPTGPVHGSYRVCRGGSWYYRAGICRVSFRYYCTPVGRNSDLGLRLAR